MSSDTYEVTLLREGFEENAEDGYVKRQCNTVLVRGPCGTMVINPGSPWDGPALVEALKKYGVADPSLVKYVVCTDGRATHVGCLSLFTKAEMIIVGHDIQKPGNVFIQHDFMDDSVPFEFDENVGYSLYFIFLLRLFIDLSILALCHWHPWVDGSAGDRLCKGYHHASRLLWR